MAAEQDFESVFSELRAMLVRFSPPAVLTTDEPGGCILYATAIQRNKQPMYFGAVQIKKNYVSFHFFPVYVNPALVANLSPKLQARMQGKACFNFTKSDPTLFEELRSLTQTGFDYFVAQGYFKPAEPGTPPKSV